VPLPAAAEVTGWLAGLQAGCGEAKAFAEVLPPHLQAWSELPPGTELFEILYTFRGSAMAAGPPAVFDVIEPRVPAARRLTSVPFVAGRHGTAGRRDRPSRSRTTAAGSPRGRRVWLLEQMERLLGELAASGIGGIEGEGRTLGQISLVSGAEDSDCGSLVHELFRRPRTATLRHGRH